MTTSSSKTAIGSLRPWATDSLYVSGGYIYGTVDAPADDEEAESMLSAMQNALPEGWTVDWTGTSNTDADGCSTEDIIVSRENEI